MEWFMQKSDEEENLLT